MAMLGTLVAHFIGMIIVALATWGGLVLYKVLNKTKDAVMRKPLSTEEELGGRFPKPAEKKTPGPSGLE